MDQASGRPPEQPSGKPKKPRPKARLIEGKCIACGARCQQACPTDAIQMNDRGEPQIIVEECIGCRKCVKVCPADALEMTIPEGEHEPAEQPSAATESAAEPGQPVGYFAELFGQRAISSAVAGGRLHLAGRSGSGCYRRFQARRVSAGSH